MMFTTTTFGQIDGRDVTLYTLRNRNGMQVQLSNFGGIVHSIQAPDRLGHLADIVLGYDDLQGYLHDPHYFGACCGRYANRIARGQCVIDGVPWQLDCNLPPHHLHGGAAGFHKQIWRGKAMWRDGAQGVLLSLESPAGESGYPGSLAVELLVLLTEDNTLRMDTKATTDQPTPVSLTHHGYFNLDGAGQGDVSEHLLTIAANQLTPVDDTQIPKGTLHPVEHTPFDFRKPRRIGEGLGLVQRDQQLGYGQGYDHNFVLTMTPGALRFVARLESPASGRIMEVRTTMPGMQLYTANHIGGTVGKGGVRYPRYGGLCLEPQHFPDAPNQPDFPDAILRPGEAYRHTTTYRFTSH